VTNQPGRIELTADDYLPCPGANQQCELLAVESHQPLWGSGGAEIAAPFADLYLRSTNGILNLTNVLVPALPARLVSVTFSARADQRRGRCYQPLPRALRGYPARAVSR